MIYFTVPSIHSSRNRDGNDNCFCRLYFYTFPIFFFFKSNIKDWKNEDEVRAYLRKIVKKEAFDKSGLIYGMGHAIYTISDPREVLLKNKARALAVEKNCLEEFDLYDMIERISPSVIAEVHGSEKQICANVDFYSGFVYTMLNIPRELFTPIFAISAG